MVNSTIMQMPDVSATKPVRIHSAAFCHQFGFTTRFGKAATAFGKRGDDAQGEVDIVD